MWPVLLMGSHSAMPSTRPNSMAFKSSRMFTVKPPYLDQSFNAPRVS